jgi:hypothetical protein
LYVEVIPRYAKDISLYNPYNVAMREVEGRQVLAPKSKIEAKHADVKTHMPASSKKIEGKHMDIKTHMPATSRIPVSRAVWAELSGLRKPGETYDHMLAEMIEREKENRFFEDMDRIEKRGKFVAMEW